MNDFEFHKHSDAFFVVFVGGPSEKIRQQLLAPLGEVSRLSSQEVDSDLILY